MTRFIHLSIFAFLGNYSGSPNLFVHDVARQGLEKSTEGILLVRRKVEGTDVGVEVGIGDSSSIVEIQNLFQAHEATIVHVGCCQLDIAQRRGLKLSFILRPVCDYETARIKWWLFAAAPVPCHAGVVKFLIGVVAA